MNADVIMRDARPRLVSRATTAPVEGVLALLDAEPANVIFPLVGATFRAALGWSSLFVHVRGERDVGKTYLTRLILSFFDGLRVSVNPVMLIDDDQRTHDYDAFSMVFSGALDLSGVPHSLSLGPHNALAVLKNSRPGNLWGADPPERLILRMLTRGTDLVAVCQRAQRGELASFMGAFTRWRSSQFARDHHALKRLDRTAAHAEMFGKVDRATLSQLRQVALGLNELFAFLRAGCGVPETVIAHHRGRMWAALREVAAQQTP